MVSVPNNQKVTLTELVGVKLSVSSTFDTYREPTEDELLADFPKLYHNDQVVPISQSMVKAYRKMKLGQFCPLRFFHKYITREYVDESGQDSEAKKAGRRFEYEMTGGLDRKGEVPDELLTAKLGVPSTTQKRLSENAAAARATLERLGFNLENAETGVTICTDEGLTGTFDLLCTYQNEPCVVDIKYSGLIGDKWNDFGWNDEHDTNNHISLNQTHRTQAVHYQLLSKLYKPYQRIEVMPFFFAVFDNRKGHEGEYKVFQIETEERHRKQHLREIEAMIEDLQEHANLKAEPRASRCAHCPVIGCASRTEFEPVTVVRLA